MPEFNEIPMSFTEALQDHKCVGGTNTVDEDRPWHAIPRPYSLPAAAKLEPAGVLGVAWFVLACLFASQSSHSQIVSRIHSKYSNTILRNCHIYQYYTMNNNEHVGKRRVLISSCLQFCGFQLVFVEVCCHRSSGSKRERGREREREREKERKRKKERKKEIKKETNKQTNKQTNDRTFGSFGFQLTFAKPLNFI